MESIEAEAGNGQLTGEDYLQILSPGEAYDLLVIRDLLHEAQLTLAEQQQVKHLDDLLIKHRQLIYDNVPEDHNIPLSLWWWHLHKGPQVREQALRAS